MFGMNLVDLLCLLGLFQENVQTHIMIVKLKIIYIDNIYDNINNIF